MPWSKRRKRFNRTFDVERHKRYLFMRSVQGWLSQNISAALDHALLYGIDPMPGSPPLVMPPMPDAIRKYLRNGEEEK